MTLITFRQQDGDFSYFYVLFVDFLPNAPEDHLWTNSNCSFSSEVNQLRSFEVICSNSLFRVLFLSSIIITTVLTVLLVPELTWPRTESFGSRRDSFHSRTEGFGSLKKRNQIECFLQVLLKTAKIWISMTEKQIRAVVSLTLRYFRAKRIIHRKNRSYTFQEYLRKTCMYIQL